MAIGGAVENGVCDTVLDWAAFLFEYSAFVPPIRSGPTLALPGTNVAYRRSCMPKSTAQCCCAGSGKRRCIPCYRKKASFYI